MALIRFEKIYESYLEDIQTLTKLCSQYDAGQISSYKLISVLLRKLLHNTSMSYGLLKQIIDRRHRDLFTEIPFVSSCVPYADHEINGTKYTRSRIIKFFGHILPDSKITYMKCVPCLYENLESVFMCTSFEHWWKKDVILIYENQDTASRKDVVCTVANKLGGVHYDTKINTVVSNILDNASKVLSIETEMDEKHIIKVETSSLFPAIIRQIAEELLSTNHNIIIPFLKNKKIELVYREEMKSNVIHSENLHCNTDN